MPDLPHCAANQNTLILFFILSAVFASHIYCEVMENTDTSTDCKKWFHIFLFYVLPLVFSRLFSQ